MITGLAKTLKLFSQLAIPLVMDEFQLLFKSNVDIVNLKNFLVSF